MEFNPSKCNVIRVTRRRTPFKFQYKPHGKVLETVDTTKYLGINLLHDLRWNDHVNAITAKANKTVSLICYLLLNGDLWSSGDLTHVSVCCTSNVMD